MFNGLDNKRKVKVHGTIWLAMAKEETIQDGKIKETREIIITVDGATKVKVETLTITIMVGEIKEETLVMMAGEEIITIQTIVVGEINNKVVIMEAGEISNKEAAIIMDGEVTMVGEIVNNKEAATTVGAIKVAATVGAIKEAITAIMAGDY
jgi:plasmid maintenance system antidote protein VapI